MNQNIGKELADGVLYLTLERPEKKNALTQSMYQTLTQTLAAADEDPEVRVIHLTGSGDSFCAGNDIADFIAAGQSDYRDLPGLHFLQQLHRQRKPVVVAVNGIAVGIGVTLLLHCDIAYAVESARFRLPFVDLGVVPEGGSSQILPQMLGHRKAAELLLACEPFDAGEAERYGIINHSYPAEQLLSKSREMALKLAAKPAVALQQAKQMLKANTGKPLDEVLPAEVALFMERLGSEETQKILRSYLSQ
ncbi:enoyl-CoA hydratase [Marinobacterium sp. YM272]|uniref:enoyl-CoA hydratase n=1 Tax=Marinobacterium sp. YM272 TaxID=3421654 RepID=UPI003D7F7A53